MESNLEQLIEKSAKVRESVSRILIKNFPIEQEFADFLAMDVVNQAIGTEALAKYNEQKLQIKREKEEAKKAEERAKRRKEYTLLGLRFTGITLSSLTALFIVGMFLWWAVTGMYACATKSPYPRTYEPLSEAVRFADERRNGLRDESVEGLDDDSLLCVKGYAYHSDAKIQDQTVGCIHRNKLSALNNALDKAVKEDINGVVWEEPNGNGEVWTIVRNNYRFVVTANKDENFIKP